MFDDNEITEDETILKVGVVGFSAQNFDEGVAEEAITEIFDSIEDEYIKVGEFENIEIVSGLTNQGIPKIAYEIGEDRGYKLVGYAPSEAEGYELYPVDEIIWDGENFGDESAGFVDYIDIFVKIGGGQQSEYELSLAEDEDIGIYEFEFE